MDLKLGELALTFDPIQLLTYTDSDGKEVKVPGVIAMAVRMFPTLGLHVVMTWNMEGALGWTMA